MAKIIPFRRGRASGSWDADMRIHNPETCSKVARRIACDLCEYPQSEAWFADEADYQAYQRDMQHDCGCLPEVIHTVEFDTAFLECITQGHKPEGDDDAEA